MAGLSLLLSFQVSLFVKGVLKSLRSCQVTFRWSMAKQPRYFVYDSSRLGDLDSFANSSDLQIMVINSQAFNAKGKDARRIHSEQESFRWRRPMTSWQL